MDSADLILLSMLKAHLLKVRYTFKEQKFVKNRSTFYSIMNKLEKSGYIRGVADSHNSRSYEFSDKGFIIAIFKQSDIDTPIDYQQMIKGKLRWVLD